MRTYHKRSNYWKSNEEEDLKRLAFRPFHNIETTFEAKRNPETKIQKLHNFFLFDFEICKNSSNVVNNDIVWNSAKGTNWKPELQFFDEYINETGKSIVLFWISKVIGVILIDSAKLFTWIVQNLARSSSRLRVCIIGSGPAGLVTAKVAMDHNFEVVVYEKNNSIGGLWSNCDDSKMYKGLLTNSPRPIMEFQGAPFGDDSLPTYLEPKHVLKYLEDFKKNMNIGVRCGTNVDRIQHDGHKWKVYHSIDDKKSIPHSFDAVFICSGVFSTPNQLLEHSQFKGAFIHSQDFKDPSVYSGKTVAVIGSGASGIDIAQITAKHANQVYLIGSTSYEGLRWNVKKVTARVIDIGSTWVRLSNGDVIDDIDDIISATGYELKYPFLPQNLLDQKVPPLYQHIVHRDHPTSLFFIGIPLAVSHFPLNEVQAKYACSVLSGRCKVPSVEDYNAWFTEQMRLNKSIKEFHTLGNMQWPYMKELATLGNFEHWKRYELMEKIYLFAIYSRNRRVGDYKSDQYKLCGDDDFTVEYSTKTSKLKIAVIGAGAAGLISAKHALDEGHDVTVYERKTVCDIERKAQEILLNAKVANVSREITNNEERKTTIIDEKRCCTSSTKIQPNLRKLSNTIPIEYNTVVQNVDRANGKWQVTTKNANKFARDVEYFDAVFLANGRIAKSRPVMEHFQSNEFYKEQSNLAVDLIQPRIKTAIVNTKDKATKINAITCLQENSIITQNARWIY